MKGQMRISGLVFKGKTETDFNCGSRWLTQRPYYVFDYDLPNAPTWRAHRHISGVLFEAKAKTPRAAVARLLRLEKRVLRELGKDAK